LNYWDTSGLVKLSVDEYDSEQFRSLTSSSPSNELTSSITSTELLCVLLRKEREALIAPGSGWRLFRKFQAQCDSGVISLIPYNQDVTLEVERLARLAYGQPRPILIRSLDLIHVASAKVGGADAIVTTDKRLAALARLLQIPVIPEAVQ
jgi:predicted nucleic acid-binding protein